MSLYNMLNGVTGATFFILPMLGHHPDTYPRFRDCFTSDPDHPELDDHIHIYTRTGGNNRDDYDNSVMTDMDGFITDFDDGFDNTFASFVFKVPDRWKDDYDKIKAGKLKDISPEYKAELYRVWPKLKEKFDVMFAPEIEEATP